MHLNMNMHLSLNDEYDMMDTMFECNAWMFGYL